MPSFKPAFDLHVFPLLKRALVYQWVNKYNRFAPTGPGGSGDFTTLSGLDDPDGSHDDRQAVFGLLRAPGSPASATLPPRAMPALFSDDYFADPTRHLVQILSRPQYRILQEWAAGNSTAPAPVGTPPPPTPPITPDDYTRVTLEACVGASFCPGIEAGRKIRDASIYLAGEAFRFDHAKLKPGELTQSMALPWQADFLDCTWEDPPSGPPLRGRGWWPAQRPDHVLLQPGDGIAAMVDWDRGAATFPLMVQNWHKLGVVLETKDAGGQPAFVETQRTLDTLPTP